MTKSRSLSSFKLIVPLDRFTSSCSIAMLSMTAVDSVKFIFSFKMSQRLNFLTSESEYLFPPHRNTSLPETYIG